MDSRSELSQSQQLFKLIQNVTSSRFVLQNGDSNFNIDHFVQILKGGTPSEEESGCRLVISKYEFKESQLIASLEHLLNLAQKHTINHH